MKKKGLIVATIVMVLVLAASITTATYAWFSVEASATINAISIVTTASDGLQIASYDPTDSTLNLYSGEVVPRPVSHAVTQGDLYWGSETLGSFGSTLTLQAAAGEGEGNNTQISNMYGASGNGVTMFFNADNDQKLDATGKPESFDAAVANVNYFVLDFILQSTAAADGTVYIRELDVTPTIKNNMAGSARIALFAKEGNEMPSGESEWTISNDGKFLYDPYGAQRLNNGVWSAGNDMSTMKFATAAGPYNTVMSQTALNDISNWGTKYFAPAVTTVNTPVAISNTFASLEAATTANQNFSLGVLSSANYMTLRLVIWFDGEDSACTQLSAGGGIDVNINFGLEVASVGP